MYECVTGEKPAEVLERLHAGMGNPLAGGKWPGYGKKFLAAIDAAMIVKPEDRPQSIGDWLAMFGKTMVDEAEADEGDEATRFIAQQVETEEIVPVPPTDAASAVDTGVPDDPKQVKFKRAGRETTTSKKIVAPPETVEPVAAKVKSGKSKDDDVAEKPAPAAKVAPSEPRSGPKPAVLIGAGAAALIAVVAAGAMFMRGGGSEPVPSIQAGPDAGGNADIVLGPGTDQPVTDANAAEVAQNAPLAEANPQAAEQTNASDALRKEAAKTAAAEARLAAMQRAAARNAAQQAGTGAAASQRPARSASAASAASTAAEADSGAGVSAAKLSQFYGIVDSARGMAKRVMRSSNSANAQLARSYDANLKTLRDSIRGVNSDREADRLIKQANQTKAYVEFLVKQSP